MLHTACEPQSPPRTWTMSMQHFFNVSHPHPKSRLFLFHLSPLQCSSFGVRPSLLCSSCTPPQLRSSPRSFLSRDASLSSCSPDATVSVVFLTVRPRFKVQIFQKHLPVEGQVIGDMHFWAVVEMTCPEGKRPHTGSTEIINFVRDP